MSTSEVPRTKKKGASTAWSRSPRFKAIALAALVRAREIKARMPKCGAKAKSTGERCRHAARENGKCLWHGGATPKGDQWHRLQLPAADTKREWTKFKVKQIRQAKSAKHREALIHELSPSEVARVRKWAKDHRPGSKASRAARKAEESTNAELRDLLSRPYPPASEAAAAARKAIDDLRDRLAGSGIFTGGVFD